MTASFQEIEEKVDALDHARKRMAELVGRLNDGMKALAADQMPAVRQAVDEASALWVEVETLIRENPQHFTKPKTRNICGITVGFAKSRGGLEIPNADKTVALIKKLFPEQADVLIDTTEKPAKGALAQMAAADLKRVAVNVKDTGDRVVIRPIDTAVDELVKALVHEAVADKRAEQD